MLGLGAGLQIFIQLDRPQGSYYRGDVVHAAITLQSLEEVSVRSISAGRLLIEPRRNIKARAVRLLQSGLPDALDFALPVPHRWRPNHRTFKSSSTNRIKAVVDVP
jgi:hypothetical protein